MAATPRKPATALARAIEAYRKARGWNRAEFARAAGLGEHDVTRWVNGQHMPSYRKLEEMAANLGVKLSAFLRLGETGEAEALDGVISATSRSLAHRIERLSDAHRRVVEAVIDSLLDPTAGDEPRRVALAA
ncbi:MAG TPA: helix-turn-helix transcriptional regulator [Limnochordia bacterium]